ncbi:DUF4124 domain-containing protein [Psychromonas algarum]|uniref:DUF4124 domain-containing protein n=1 Tax=Psychromonas algarum TaxID=2555643 RepID=UPI00141957C1|nr:DUF4124 domain-containing protein [Psychromonas sp. RZ22]
MPYFFNLLLFLVPFSTAAEIYTWKDDKGVTHFAQEKPADRHAENVIVNEQKPATQPQQASSMAQQDESEAPATEVNQEEQTSTQQIDDSDANESQPVEVHQEVTHSKKIDSKENSASERYIQKNQAAGTTTNNTTASEQIDDIKSEGGKPMVEFINNNEIAERPE